MAKTANQIIGDIRQMLLDSTLATQITGDIYRNGTRPRGSRKEDATIAFATGIPDEIQTGIVIINVYVPDIDADADGTYIENIERTEQIEHLAGAWVDSLTAEISCYRFRLAQTIYTQPAPEIAQHFVSIRLQYQYYGTDYAPIHTPQQATIDATDTTSNTDYYPILQTENGETLIIQPKVQKLKQQ